MVKTQNTSRGIPMIADDMFIKNDIIVFVWVYLFIMLLSGLFLKYQVGNNT